MWFGEPHPFPERESPTRLSASDNKVTKGDRVYLLTHLFFIYKFQEEFSQSIHWFRVTIMTTDSYVGIATGRSGDRIPVGGGRDFRHSSRPALGPTQPPVQ